MDMLMSAVCEGKDNRDLLAMDMLMSTVCEGKDNRDLLAMDMLMSTVCEGKGGREQKCQCGGTWTCQSLAFPDLRHSVCFHI